MKTALVILLALATRLTLAHEGVELGPNGGRILEFSDNETMHGEVLVKDGRFHIALLDKDMKPATMADQSLTAMTGDRAKPVKLEVKKEAKGFTLPLVPAGQWLILRYKENAAAKAVTARLEYNTAICGDCQGQEWLCRCKPDQQTK